MNNNSSNWSGFYKVISPQIETTDLADNRDVAPEGVGYGNYSYHNMLLAGAGSRIAKYKEYNAMDQDIDVAKALDTIAEEVVGNRTKTNKILEINADESLSAAELKTLDYALERWNDIHKFNVKLFRIIRNTLKMGDTFFAKSDPFKSWQHVTQQSVKAIVVNSSEINTVIGYEIDQATTVNATGTSAYASVNKSTKKVTRGSIVRFSLFNDMSESAPFGESILKEIYRSYKQKELLEDAIIIYRIQRAPERRVFYIDVGKMPPHKSKAYLNQVKNEIRQRKIPSPSGGGTQVDSVYNPQSMNEDFFFATNGSGKGTKVDTLPGGDGLGKLDDLEYFQEKIFRGLKIPISYFKQGAEGGVFNDGKVGVSYIQELRFALYVERLQTYFETVLDEEFKTFLRYSDISINPTKFKIELPEPSNFGKYREQELDSSLLNSYNQADGIKHLSKRFGLQKYLKLTDAEMLRNEQMIAEERGIKPNDPMYTAKIYSEDYTPGEDDHSSSDFGDMSADTDMPSPDLPSDSSGGESGSGLDDIDTGGDQVDMKPET